VLLERAGLDTDKARAVADILVEADLLGHDTHGLNLLASYLQELETGGMTKSGQPRVVHDKPAALTWDGKRLPGPWLVLAAIDAAIPRAKELGTCTVVISRSHHIASRVVPPARHRAGPDDPADDLGARQRRCRSARRQARRDDA
jgi:L-lactate dehydrogenase